MTDWICARFAVIFERVPGWFTASPWAQTRLLWDYT